MPTTINAKELRATLPEVVARVRKGARYTVIYRSKAAFRIVPMDEKESSPAALEEDPLYRAPALGRSRDGHEAADHDAILYGS